MKSQLSFCMMLAAAAILALGCESVGNDNTTDGDTSEISVDGDIASEGDAQTDGDNIDMDLLDMDPENGDVTDGDMESDYQIEAEEELDASQDGDFVDAENDGDSTEEIDNQEIDSDFGPAVFLLEISIADSTCCFDLNDDGQTDNTFGKNVLMPPLLNPLFSDAIEAGRYVQLFEFTQVESWSDDADIGMTLYEGRDFDNDFSDNLDPAINADFLALSTSFDPDTDAPIYRAGQASLTDGVFEAEDAVFLIQGIRFNDTSPSGYATVREARIEGNLASARAAGSNLSIAEGKIGGYLLVSDLESLLCGPDQPLDCNTMLSIMGEPDIDSNQDSLPDAYSIGLSFTAKPATIAGVALPCDPDPCNGHGDCEDQDGSCVCNSPYDGETCDTCQEGYINYPACDADPCSNVQCSDNAYCLEGKCFCEEGWIGPSCEFLEGEGIQCDPCVSDLPVCSEGYMCIGFSSGEYRCLKDCSQDATCPEGSLCTVSYCNPDGTDAYECSGEDVINYDTCGGWWMAFNCEEGVTTCSLDPLGCVPVADGDMDAESDTEPESEEPECPIFDSFIGINTSGGGTAGCYDCAHGQPNTVSMVEFTTERYFSATDSVRIYAYGDNGGMCTSDYFTCWDSSAQFGTFDKLPEHVTFWMNADLVPFTNRFVEVVTLKACDANDCTSQMVVSETCDVDSSDCASHRNLMVNCEETTTGADGRSWCRQTFAWPSERDIAPFHIEIQAYGQRWDSGGQDSWIEIFVDDLCLSNAVGQCCNSLIDDDMDAEL